MKAWKIAVYLEDEMQARLGAVSTGLLTAASATLPVPPALKSSLDLQLFTSYGIKPDSDILE